MSLPFDLTEIITAHLGAERRENDGLLHASSHLTSSLRHAQLSVAGAPVTESPFVSAVRMYTGTMWHKAIAEALQADGVSFMSEVNMTPWMPQGWGGTADLWIWNPRDKHFLLRDLKTIKGEGIRWIVKDGAKEEHIWQVSAYYHAGVRAGWPVGNECGIYYLPMNAVTGENVEPVEITFKPLSWDILKRRMDARSVAAKAYASSVRLALGDTRPLELEGYLTHALAPPQERVLKPSFLRASNQWELKLVPHWSSRYCPYQGTILCDCSEQGTTKVGHWTDDGEYVPRSGYDVTPPPFPGR